jgi:hypothetical protein
MTYFITIAGRRWPCEETFKTGKDVLGWDQCQARTWDGICRHTDMGLTMRVTQWLGKPAAEFVHAAHW